MFFKDGYTKFKEEYAFLDISISITDTNLPKEIVIYFALHQIIFKVSEIDAFLVQFPKINKSFLTESIYIPSSLK